MIFPQVPARDLGISRIASVRQGEFEALHELNDFLAVCFPLSVATQIVPQLLFLLNSIQLLTQKCKCQNQPLWAWLTMS